MSDERSSGDGAGETASPQAADSGPAALSRRGFVTAGASLALTLGSGVGLTACGGGNAEEGQRFGYGVASGDPLSDRVIIWTRVNVSNPTEVQWEVATDSAFAVIVRSGSAATDTGRDYTVKVDVTGLQAATTYFYRFRHSGQFSVTGRTRTLPVGTAQQVKLAVFSCAAYPLGQFHAYNHAANRADFDVALMLGDYIYETGLSSAEQAAAGLLGREVDPRGELVVLSEYRQRYARYHTDADLRALRANMPIIAVWDDHEIANDTWRGGAGGHDPATEGSFADRRDAAVRAWHEWMPTRDGSDPLRIYRSFDFGNLLSLHMLDTRVIGRDAPLTRNSWLAGGAADPNRQLLGAEQAAWLAAQMQASTATWQVLGQQVLMGRMQIPLSVYDDFTEASLTRFMQAQDTAEASRTPEQRALLEQPRIGYDLSTWDSFMAQRESVLGTARALDRNLIVLSGDSHNAWASNLKDQAGHNVGVEFATPSVTSTGLEVAHSDIGRQFMADSFVKMVPDLKYAETSHRGYLTVTLTPAAATADWIFVSSVFENSYSASVGRTLRTLPGSANRTLGTA